MPLPLSGRQLVLQTSGQNQRHPTETKGRFSQRIRRNSRDTSDLHLESRICNKLHFGARKRAECARLPASRPVLVICRADSVLSDTRRASNSTQTDFVKRQVERVLGELDQQVGSIPATIRDELLKKVGTGDGQVLQPVLDASQLTGLGKKSAIGPRGRPTTVPGWRRRTSMCTRPSSF